jgi:hypothetical protein
VNKCTSTLSAQNLTNLQIGTRLSSLKTRQILTFQGLVEPELSQICTAIKIAKDLLRSNSKDIDFWTESEYELVIVHYESIEKSLDIEAMVRTKLSPLSPLLLKESIEYIGEIFRRNTQVDILNTDEIYTF